MALVDGGSASGPRIRERNGPIVDPPGDRLCADRPLDSVDRVCTCHELSGGRRNDPRKQDMAATYVVRADATRRLCQSNTIRATLAGKRRRYRRAVSSNV